MTQDQHRQQTPTLEDIREAYLEDVLDAYWEDVNVYERQREREFFESQEQDEMERERDEAREQRDRLADALERILSYQGRFAEEEPESIANEALQSLTPNKL